MLETTRRREAEAGQGAWLTSQTFFGEDISRATSQFTFSWILRRHGKGKSIPHDQCTLHKDLVNSREQLDRRRASSELPGCHSLADHPGQDPHPNPHLTRIGTIQAWRLAEQVLGEIIVGTRVLPDVFLKSPLRRGQMTAAWLQIVYEEAAAAQGTRCAVATLDALRECSTSLGSSIAHAKLPPSDFHIKGQYWTRKDEYWTMAEDREEEVVYASVESAREAIRKAQGLERATGLLETMAATASQHNMRTGQGAHSHHCSRGPALTE